MVVTGSALLVAALLAGAALSAGIAVYAWGRKDTPARVPFVGLAATDAVWVSLHAVALVAPDTPLRLTLEALYLAVGTLVGVWWVLFGLAYTGRTRFVSPVTAALLALPTIGLLAMVALDPTASLLWSAEAVTAAGVTTVAETAVTPLFLGVVGYLYAAISVGYLLVLRGLTAGRSLYSAQTGWMLAGSVPAAVAGVLDGLAIGSGPRVHLVPFTVPLVMAGFAVALFRYDMADVTPATGRVGREAALRDLADPVIVTDGAGQVADCNPAAASTFGVSPDDAVGATLAAITGAGDDADVADGAILTLETAEGRRRFEVSASQVRPEGERSVGRALVLRDITRRQFREQRLEVFNRVVRHNLRNDMNVVAGHAEILESTLDGDGTGGGDEHVHVDTIREIARELVDLGQKAHAFEKTVTGDTGAERVVVADVVRHVFDRLDASDRATVVLETPDDLGVVTDGSVLEIVLHNAVENALDHAGESPQITVTGRETESGVRISVGDDGPGVPADERRVLESGGESPLEHGSGLGLWIVTWGTQWLGGEVELDCEDGTTVTVTVPDLEAGTRPAPTVDGLQVDTDSTAAGGVGATSPADAGDRPDGRDSAGDERARGGARRAEPTGGNADDRRPRPADRRGDD